MGRVDGFDSTTVWFNLLDLSLALQHCHIGYLVLLRSGVQIVKSLDFYLICCHYNLATFHVGYSMLITVFIRGFESC